MAIQNVAGESWSCFWSSLSGLVSVTWPYMLASIGFSIVTSLLPEGAGLLLSSSIGALEAVMFALITLAGLRFLYALDGEELGIDGKKVLFLIIATLYIGVAAMFGFLFFVVPGVIILVVTFLMPIFVLKESQGPIQSVASSASLIKDDLLVTTLFLGAILLAIVAAEFGVSQLLGYVEIPNPVSVGLAHATSLMVSLYTLPLMKLLDADLKDQNALSAEDLPTG